MLYIKNMVCDRCKKTVRAELDNLGIRYNAVELGEVTTVDKIAPAKQIQLKNALLEYGFELIDEQKYELIERLKKAIVELEEYTDEELKTSFTDYLTLRIKDNFISMNILFAEVKGMTIEKYIIRHKIERVKELLVYDDLSLSEIAFKMHYSNIVQMTKQFKRVTGLTPSHFKKLRISRKSHSKIISLVS